LSMESLNQIKNIFSEIKTYKTLTQPTTKNKFPQPIFTPKTKPNANTSIQPKVNKIRTSLLILISKEFSSYKKDSKTKINSKTFNEAEKGYSSPIIKMRTETFSPILTPSTKGEFSQQSQNSNSHSKCSQFNSKKQTGITSMANMQNFHLLFPHKKDTCSSFDEKKIKITRKISLSYKKIMNFNYIINEKAFEEELKKDLSPEKQFEIINLFTPVELIVNKQQENGYTYLSSIVKNVKKSKKSHIKSIYASPQINVNEIDSYENTNANSIISEKQMHVRDSKKEFNYSNSICGK